MYDYVILIGRFQPYHLGHRSLIQRGQALAKKKVIILVGSASAPRSIKNPFTYDERVRMISMDKAVGSNRPNLLFKPLEDYKYNDAEWIEQVQRSVLEEVNKEGWTDFPPSIGIIGLNKDETTKYLEWFPQWQSIKAEQFDAPRKFDATSIRQVLFGGLSLKFANGVLPQSTMEQIEESMIKSPWWKNLQEEYEFVNDYKKQWANSPYPPIFVTVDAVVFQQGHVLLVERGANPGKGLWALPGGFINQDERIQDAVLRELREETRLKVPEPVLKGSIFDTHVFDFPDRSLRGRTITHAFGFRLNPMDKLPPVKGSDDAAKAKWFPLCDIKRNQLFEDHWDILEYFKSRV